jgi:hypothetical protein
MPSIDDELNAAMGVPGASAMPAGTTVEKKTVTLHKTPKSRTAAEQDIYNAIKEQVLADLIKESKEAAPAPKVELIDFFVNLPVHAGMIRVDGREYYHGFSYKIKAQQRDTFVEISGKAWAHDEEVRGQRKPFDSYRLNKGM